MAKLPKYGVNTYHKQTRKKIDRDGIKRTPINTRKEWASIYLELALDKSPILTYIYSMKEVHLKVSNISNKQWASLLLELNLVKSSWRRFGPNITY